jgi:hypothetical protein
MLAQDDLRQGVLPAPDRGLRLLEAMMEGFTPTFFLEVLVAVLTAGGTYYGIKVDLKYMHKQIEEEKELRRDLAKETVKQLHDVREEINMVALQVAVIEGERRKA